MSTMERMQPEEITAADFDEAMSILPPAVWLTIGSVESFTMPEPVDHGVYDRFVRIGDRYWKVIASISTPIPELAAACRKAMGA